MDGVGIVVKSEDIFLPNNINFEEIKNNEIYKFVHKNQIRSGILLGKGSKCQCQEIIEILVQCYNSKSKKIECCDVKNI